MSTLPPNTDPRELLDLYIDGMLTDAQRSDFEALLANDTALRAEYELQKRMDEALKRRFEPDVADIAVPQPKPAAKSQVSQAIQATQAIPFPSSAKRSGSPWLRIAAMIVIAGALATILFIRPWGGSFVNPRDAYAEEVRLGFKPYVVCETDEQMVHFTKKALGHAVLVAKDPSIALIGWAYDSRVVSDNTVTLLAKAGPDQSTQIVVYMDRAANDRRISTGTGTLNVFKRELGEAVFYEVSPLSEPSILPHLYVPTH